MEGDKKKGGVKKEVIDFRINEQTLIETEKPVDFSFKKMTEMKCKIFIS